MTLTPWMADHRAAVFSVSFRGSLWVFLCPVPYDDLAILLPLWLRPNEVKPRWGFRGESSG